MEIIIRPAGQEDQKTIVSFINETKRNPRNLHWQNFWVAEDHGKVVGVRQVKVYADGTREVASGDQRGVDEGLARPGDRSVVHDGQ